MDLQSERIERSKKYINDNESVNIISKKRHAGRDGDSVTCYLKIEVGRARRIHNNATLKHGPTTLSSHGPSNKFIASLCFEHSSYVSFPLAYP